MARNIATRNLQEFKAILREKFLAHVLTLLRVQAERAAANYRIQTFEDPVSGLTVRASTVGGTRAQVADFIARLAQGDGIDLVIAPTMEVATSRTLFGTRDRLVGWLNMGGLLHVYDDSQPLVAR